MDSVNIHHWKDRENYPPKLAAKLAEALVTQVNHWDDVMAAEEIERSYNEPGVAQGTGHNAPEVEVPEEES